MKNLRGSGPANGTEMTSDQENNFRVMLSTFEEAEQGKLALDLLIPSLEMLFNAIDLADTDWQEGFWDARGELETNYAMALHRGWKLLDEIGQKLVSEAITNLKALVESNLSRIERRD
jgi:hypothetical protein